MRAYEYVGEKSVTVKDPNPMQPGQFVQRFIRLSPGMVFFVYVTKGRSVYFVHNLWGEKIQVPQEKARQFLTSKCRASKDGERVVKEASDLGFTIGDIVYFVTCFKKFEYCDSGRLAYCKGELCVYSQYNGIKKASEIEIFKNPKAYPVEKDFKMLEHILQRWDFISEPSRFAINRIRDRLLLRQNRIALIERYNQIWKVYEKNPYKSGEYFAKVKAGLKELRMG